MIRAEGKLALPHRVGAAANLARVQECAIFASPVAVLLWRFRHHHPRFGNAQILAFSSYAGKLPRCAGSQRRRLPAGFSPPAPKYSRRAAGKQRIVAAERAVRKSPLSLLSRAARILSSTGRRAHCTNRASSTGTRNRWKLIALMAVIERR